MTKSTTDPPVPAWEDLKYLGSEEAILETLRQCDLLEDAIRQVMDEETTHA